MPAAASLLTRVALGGIGISLLVLGIKWLAYRLTGSVALYSDALESIVNVVAAIAAYASIRFALRPADDSHNFGHGKAEYLSAVLEGVLILIAAVLILGEAVERLGSPPAVQAPLQGIALSTLATAINAGWALLLARMGSRHRSPALAADSRHLMSDVITSAGVVAGVGLAALTGFHILDPLLAIVVALIILRSGWQVVRDSGNGLLDAALPVADVAHIRTLIEANMQGAAGYDRLRTRRSGRSIVINVRLLVDPAMTVGDASAIVRHVESALAAGYPGGLFVIDLGPTGSPSGRGG